MAKQRLNGKVISNKMEKTVVVAVERKTAHPKYKKTIVRRKRYFAHSENDIEIGKSVTIELSKPMSKHKRWKVILVENGENKTKSKKK
ncbi:MAG: 30S ribosomal protein S17 [bacterium]